MDGDASSGRKVLMGRIGAAHGIKGEVRVQSFTDEPMNIAAYGPLDTDRPGVSVRFAALRPAGKGMLVARIEGVADRTAAERLNGVSLYLDRSLLPAHEDEDDFYLADLVGLEARLTDGSIIGRVNAVHNHGAGDILEVGNPRSGDSFLYPFTRAVVPEISIAKGYLVIEPPAETEIGEAEEPD
jgi:16S rRNA processing protein RimM